MIEGTALDHVSLAVEHIEEAWPFFIGELGGQWKSGGPNVGFAASQLLFSNNAKLEFLEPYNPEENPFLRRFLDRHGEGPHHITFIVPDLLDALEQLKAFGMQPIGINLDNPFWKEAFLHPVEAFGIVIQVAQSAGEWVTDPPAKLPNPRVSHPAALISAALVVDNLAAAKHFFMDLLGGEIRATTITPEGVTIDLAWHDSPLVLRLLGRGDNGEGARAIRDYLGHLPGKLSHLEFSAPQLPEVDSVDIADSMLIGYSPGEQNNSTDTLITKFVGTTVVVYQKANDRPATHQAEKSASHEDS
ncbi:MAG: VOC family protein [Actinobacteria bacterium]|jgi:catechol 2,3-dioxygenase-like lactoylglutathione lyase family enzyme|nr:VOC family protein [Actinomycetota bacterium]